jgi:NAD-dependent dihydropyrimidine dehydrogenase PreA subunit
MTAPDSARAGRPLPIDRRFDLITALLDKGYAVSCTRSDVFTVAPAGRARIVLGHFGDQLPPPSNTSTAAVLFQEMEGLDTAALVASIESAASIASTAAIEPVVASTASSTEQGRRQAGLPPSGAWKPWFPVIDYQRCTNCMQCLSFCLFDVYGVTPEGRIQVRNQSNCKTDCPACSRVCPEVAIMFPKYRHGPINGEAVSADDVRREAMKVDISTLLGGDIYSALRDRSAKAKSRFSKERDDQRALQERQTCLIKLAQALDVPQEVLDALPSQDRIRMDADAALARARQANDSAGS